MITRTSLRHPRVQWEIEAAMWRAVEDGHDGYGLGLAFISMAGNPFAIMVTYVRGRAGAFRFALMGHGDVTETVLSALRANAKEAGHE